jgi:hypothetical protein
MATGQDTVVQGHDSRFETPGDLFNPLHRVREDRRGELLVALSMPFEDFREILAGDHGKHRPEMVPFHEPGIGRTVDHRHRFHGVFIMRFNGSTKTASAFSHRFPYKFKAPMNLLGLDQTHRRSHRDDLLKCLYEASVHGCLDQHATRRHAGLAGIHDQGIPDRDRSQFRIGICQDDRRIAAAQLQGAGNHPVRTRPCDDSSNPGGAGEDQVIEGLFLQQRSSRLSCRLGPAEHLTIHSGLASKLEKPQLGFWRMFGRLDQDLISSCECLNQLDAEQLEGVVPGGDDPHGSQRDTMQPLML